MNEENQILIIDDSLDDVETVEEILRENGVTNVVSATKLEEAIKLIEKNNIGQVILDLGGVSPTNRPLGALETLESKFPDLQIIVLSGNNNPSISKAVEAKGKQYLLKDNALDINSPDVLAAAVAKFSDEKDRQQDMSIQELYVVLRELKERVDKLESRLFDAFRSGTGGGDLQIRYSVLEAKFDNLEPLREAFNQAYLQIELIRQEVVQLRQDDNNLEGQTKKALVLAEEANTNAKKLLDTFEKNIWLFKFLEQIGTINKIGFNKFREMMVEKVLIKIIAVLITLALFSPKFLPAISHYPFVQKIIRLFHN